ncbi:MAG: TonB-dependent receptor, partial [Pseudoxanthomonas sp.]
MKINPTKTTLSRALSLVLLGMSSSAVLAQEQAGPVAPAEAAPAQAESANATTADGAEGVTTLDTIEVTGFRRSLQFSTDAKRDAVGFTDSIFAEDIGKFPDLNIAESLTRIPGI